MNPKIIRAFVATVLVLASGGVGYVAGEGEASGANSNSAQTISAPPAGSVRVLYSLDKKQNDKEIIALIDGAEDHIYFAIYTFTLPNIADALVEAKKRGVDVRGVMDSEQSGNSYGAPVTEKLQAAGIPLLVERHASGNGIMHIKLLVTERAYAFGSYNWTNSATTINDEILEIGTDPTLRQTYENILKRLLDTYQGSTAAKVATRVSGGTYAYTDAEAHVGEYASVRGTLIKTYTSASGTTFLDFCKSYKSCPFSGVIFATDTKKFGNLSRYVGTDITLTGKISSYQGKAEIILSDPKQISK